MILNKFGDYLFFFIKIVNLVAALLHENVQYLKDEFFIALKEMVVLSDLTRRNLMTVIVPKNETEFLSKYMIRMKKKD